MAIIANDFTLGYFNFSYGFPRMISSDISQSEISTIDNDWPTMNATMTWD
jgi:hypothetical protein